MMFKAVVFCSLLLVKVAELATWLPAHVSIIKQMVSNCNTTKQDNALNVVSDTISMCITTTINRGYIDYFRPFLYIKQ